MKYLLNLAFLLSVLMFNAQAPIDGLVTIFDGLFVPYGVPVGNVSVAEDRNGGFCAIELDGELTSLILVQGVEEYIIHPDSSLSISLWYRGGSDAAGDLESLFIKYSSNLDPHANPIYGLQLYDLNTPLMSSSEHSLWVDQSVIEFPGDTAWHHLVGVFDAGYWKVYFDNTLQGTSESENAIVGSENHDLAIGPGFDGRLDDIHFYDRALDSDEVSQLFFAESLCATDLPEIEEIDVQVFPNPASESLWIDLKEVRADRLEILDALGHIVKTYTLFNNKEPLELKSIENGRYLLRFIDNGKMIGHRSFVKY